MDPVVDLVRTRLASHAGEAVAHGAPTRRPLILGIAGSVAVGKSTLAGALLDGLQAGDAAIIGTDSFLLPNDVLVDRALLDRKGFPESYDLGPLLALLDAMRSGDVAGWSVPVYSHLTYDIVPGARRDLGCPRLVIVEGINALQPELAARLDLALYLDADEGDIERWYTDRFRALVVAGRSDARSFYHRFATLDDAGVDAVAAFVWREVNLPNLRLHIAPTAIQAHAVVRMAADHTAAVELSMSRLPPEGGLEPIPRVSRMKA